MATMPVSPFRHDTSNEGIITRVPRLVLCFCFTHRGGAPTSDVHACIAGCSRCQLPTAPSLTASCNPRSYPVSHSTSPARHLTNTISTPETSKHTNRTMDKIKSMVTGDAYDSEKPLRPSSSAAPR